MRLFRCVVLLALIVHCVSCYEDAGTRELRERESRSSMLESSGGSALSTTLQRLPAVVRIERETALKEFSNELNSWGSLYPAPKDWQATALMQALPLILRDQEFSRRIQRIEFGDVEGEYLWQARLMRDLAAWVVERPYRDQLFEPWMESVKLTLEAEDSRRLEDTLKLFDWTMRNIALDGQAKAVETLAIDPSSPSTDNRIGYQTLPWQTVLFGRGDVIQRARVFTQLLFHQGIPACFLGIEGTTEASQSERRLWCVGVPIGDELYLFEPRLGLPLPRGDAAEVATLRQARSDPNVLRRAKLPGRFDYPLDTQDLKRAVALLDIEPCALGMGIRLVEDNLVGDERMKLTCDADDVASQIASIDQELRVELWSLPWLAQIYNQLVRQQIKDKTTFGVTYQSEMGAYLYETLLHDARLAHLRGEFETTIDKEGAAQKYMTSRIDDATLERLPYDAEVQHGLNVVRLPNESPDEYLFRVTQMQKSFRTAKLDSHFFLGNLQFDNANVPAAIDWMEERLLKNAVAAKWHDHAKYLLARCFEVKGDLATAINWLKEENVPQEAGNRIRARLYERQRAGTEAFPP